MRTVFQKAKVVLDGPDTYLCVCIPHQIAQKFVGEMKKRKYSVEIKEYREKRSLDANAYAWVLLGKLAAKLSTPEAPVSPEFIYRECIRDIGDNYQIVPVQPEHIENWNRMWCDGHIGRMTEDMGPCRNLPGYNNIKTYLGSSDYDTRQMSQLINVIVDECRTQGIETMPPAELESMLKEWGGKK